MPFLFDVLKIESRKHEKVFKKHGLLKQRMKRIFGIGFLYILTAAHTSAQHVNIMNSKSQEESKALDSFKLPVNTRMLAYETNQKKLSLKEDSLKDKAYQSLLKKMDSLSLITQTNKIIKYATDPFSLEQNKEGKGINKKDSLQGRGTSKIDSIQNRKLLDKINASLNNHIDSLQHIRPIRKVMSAEQQLTNMEFKVNSKILDSKNKINDKLKVSNELTENVSKLKTPEINAKLKVLGKNFKNDFNSNNLLKLPKSDINLPNGPVSTNVAEIKIPTTEEIGKLNTSTLDLSRLESSEIKNISKNTDDLSKINGDAKKYQTDIQNISKGNLEKVEQFPKELETKVEGLDNIKGLQSNITEADKYKTITEKWNADPEVAKEMALNRAKESAVNYFAGHEQELQTALSKMTQLKEKYKNVEGVLDLMKKRQVNPMKGKPFTERLIPGLTLQIQKPNLLWVDLNPHLSYRLTGRFTIGAGWNGRIIYDTKVNGFTHMGRIYGVRSFIQFKLKDGLWLKGDIEKMNAGVPFFSSSTGSPDVSHRAWVSSYFGGLKKDFKLSRKLIASTQVLYNLYNPKHESPYADKINFRFSIEYKIAKKSQ